VQKNLETRTAGDDLSQPAYQTATDVVEVEVTMDRDLIHAFRARWSRWRRAVEDVLTAAANKL